MSLNLIKNLDPIKWYIKAFIVILVVGLLGWVIFTYTNTMKDNTGLTVSNEANKTIVKQLQSNLTDVTKGVNLNTQLTIATNASKVAADKAFAKHKDDMNTKIAEIERQFPEATELPHKASNVNDAVNASEVNKNLSNAVKTPANTASALNSASGTISIKDVEISKVRINAIWQNYCEGSPKDQDCANIKE